MRGVEAPFQLLVSVFTMVLVVAIAFHVLNTVSKERCAQQWDHSFSSLASTIVRVGESSYPTTASTELRLKCGGSARHFVEIREESGSLCSRVCGEVSDVCYVLVHAVRDVRGRIVYSKPVCVRNLSPYHYFLLKRGAGSCPPGYSPLFSNDLNAELQSVGILPVYVFRGEKSVQVCKKSG